MTTSELIAFGCKISQPHDFRSILEMLIYLNVSEIVERGDGWYVVCKLDACRSPSVTSVAHCDQLSIQLLIIISPLAFTSVETFAMRFHVSSSEL